MPHPVSYHHISPMEYCPLVLQGIAMSMNFSGLSVLQKPITYGKTAVNSDMNGIQCSWRLPGCSRTTPQSLPGGQHAGPR